MPQLANHDPMQPNRVAERGDVACARAHGLGDDYFVDDIGQNYHG